MRTTVIKASSTSPVAQSIHSDTRGNTTSAPMIITSSIPLTTIFVDRKFISGFLSEKRRLPSLVLWLPFRLQPAEKCTSEESTFYLFKTLTFLSCICASAVTDLDQKYAIISSFIILVILKSKFGTASKVNKNELSGALSRVTHPFVSKNHFSNDRDIHSSALLAYFSFLLLRSGSSFLSFFPAFFMNIVNIFSIGAISASVRHSLCSKLCMLLAVITLIT